MKFLVALSLLSLAAAKPQYFLPYNAPHLLTPTVQTAGNAPVINTYTATYPYSGFPFVQAALPQNYRFPYTFSPFINAVKPDEAGRQKRSADAEPEADPALVYTTGLTTTGAAINYPTVATVPTAAVNYQYSGYPAAISTYSYPQQTVPYTGINAFTGLNPYAGFQQFTGVSPYAGLQSFTGVSPYSGFPWFNPIVTPTKSEAAEPEDSSVVRSKRSADPEADPEADPQFLTTGVTGFTYPAVNTRTQAGTYTYQTLPTNYGQIPTTYSQFPNTYNAGGFPFQQYFPGTNQVIYG